MTGPFSRAALHYHRLGFRPLPLRSGGKEPILPDWPNAAARATEADVIAWSKWFTRANIGLAAGHGFWVIDVDPRNGGDRTWNALARANDMLPITPTAETGGQGHHILFSLPAGMGVRLTALGQGIECLGQGHQIVAAPSVHPSGRIYKWLPEAHPTNTPIAPTPPWLAARVFCATRERTRETAIGTAAQSFLGVAFRAANWLGRDLPGGKAAARCPWVETHSADTGGGADSSAALLPPTREFGLGMFRCLHAHCYDRRLLDVLDALPRAAIQAASTAHPRAMGTAAVMRARKVAAHGR
jgi:hypothetical protein